MNRLAQFDYNTPLKKLLLKDYEYCLKKFCTQNGTITINQFKEALKDRNYSLSEELVPGTQLYNMMTDAYFVRETLKHGGGISQD